MSSFSPHTLALIPAYNEQKSISRLVESLLRMELQVWVLDDGSTDNTAELAEKQGARVYRFPELRGKTARLRGALRRIPSEVQWILCLDGDGQHDPGDFENFLKVAEEADLVIGNRFHHPRGMPFLRFTANKLMSAMLNMMSGGTHADTQCGYRLIRRGWLGSWLPRGNDFEWESELYLHAIRTGGRVKSVPVRCIYGEEESQISFWRDLNHFLRLLWRTRHSGNSV
jgi:glycosyltransferase involved in cell wall biosynthesis